MTLENALTPTDPASGFKRYNTNASLLRTVDSSKQVVLKFEKVSAFVPVLVGAGSNNKPLTKQLTSLCDGGHDAEAPPSERQVLFDVDGQVSPGEVLALMGPSGSGKSSLLAVLGGRSTARIQGSVTFNGKRLDKPMKRTLGYVMQDDLLYEELTTYETLYYAALLRLPREWSKEAKKERVEMVLAGLGLTKCRDTIIGGHMMRGVSGGERKRVSIGHELLINPSVIMMDEPTSGLDSTTALKLIHTMRSLASGGRTIVASIHQPSSRLYQEFDKLMLLSEGYTMYYGDAHASAHWFAQHGVPVPFGVSIPDHLLDLACGDLPGMTSEASQQKRKVLVESFRNRIYGLGADGVLPSDYTADGRPLLPYGRADAHKRAAITDGTASSDHSDADPGGLDSRADSDIGLSPSAVQVAAHVSDEQDVVDGSKLQSSDVSAIQIVNSSGVSNRMISNKTKVHVELSTEVDIKSSAPGSRRATDDGDGELSDMSQHKWGATWFEQVKILTTRCVRIRRFSALSVQRYAEVIIPAILSGLFWWQLGGKDTLSKQHVLDLGGLLFFMVLFMGFSALFQALFTFPADFQMLVKERQSGMYRLSAYYVARAISDIPMDCLVPTIFAWIIYWMSGLRISPGAFFCNWFTLLLTVLVAQSMGLFISATVMNSRTALALSTIYMLCIMLVAGFYVQSIPIWIRWLKYTSFVWYSYNLMLKVEFSGRGYDCADFYRDNPNAEPGKTWCSISEGNVLPVDVDESTALEACVLIGFLLLFRILVYVSLKQKTTFKGKAE